MSPGASGRLRFSTDEPWPVVVSLAAGARTADRAKGNLRVPRFGPAIVPQCDGTLVKPYAITPLES